MDREIAKHVVEEITSLDKHFNRLTEISIELDADEGVALRKLIAKVMISSCDLLRHVIRQHPDLDPDK